MLRLPLLILCALAVYGARAANYDSREAYAADNEVELELVLVKAKLPAACKDGSRTYLDDTGASEGWPGCRRRSRTAGSGLGTPPRKRPPAARRRPLLRVQTCLAATSSPRAWSRWTMMWAAEVRA